MSISKMLAMSLGLAITAGPAAATEAWSSFTDRVQEHQGIGQASGSAVEQEYTATEPAAPMETGSFTDRVAGWQGVNGRAAQASEQSASGEYASGEERGPAITFEATSFINRVEVTQGVGLVGSEQGAAGGEPSTR